jgi:hypothetical protein
MCDVMAYKELSGAIKRAEALRDAARDRHDEEKLKEARSEREWARNEWAKRDEKLALSKEIFSWVREFAKSEEYDKARKFLCSDDLYIFRWNWGHKFVEGQYGCWSEVRLTQEGSLRYSAGYKWMGYVKHLRIGSEEELTGKLSHDYIAKLHGSIKTGKVLEHVGRELGSLPTA